MLTLRLHGPLAHLVPSVDRCPRLHQHVGNARVSPVARLMEGRVSILGFAHTGEGGDPVMLLAKPKKPPVAALLAARLLLGVVDRRASKDW